MKRMQELAGIKKKQVLFLIGFPGSGKSTFIDKMKAKDPEFDYVIISNDSVLEKAAAKLGLNYNDAYEKISFTDVLRPAYEKELKRAIKHGRNIIIDDTNLKKADRQNALDKFPNDYKKIAVIFNIPPDELNKRLKQRAEKTGKYIPDEAINRMREYYTPPTKGEGFDKIIIV